MKKAKTQLKIIPILSALLGVVFAFTLGFVYASSVINFTYGTNAKSTAAYFANQQYIVVNDTVENAADKIMAIIRAEHAKTERTFNRYKKMVEVKP